MMNAPDDEIARVAAGNSVQVELWQQSLRDQGVESRVVGEDLSTSFGSALTGSVELWVRQADFERARQILEEVTGATGSGTGTATGNEPA